ncbi:MAG: 3-isopropylmalate dehydratase small subunit [Hyphomonadaceae bacterium]|nr:3-isopropylmalate dehydratase small subunit [Hyphomonadaceae bacterium]
MAERFTRLTSRTFVMPQASIDTDQIIPARFLTTTSKDGLGAAAFYDWRYAADGAAIPDQPLNTLDVTQHRILVAGDNFGCGSSREHAPWALLDYGFRAVISTSIADIFTSNAFKNGLLPIQVDEATHQRLVATPEREVTVDLEQNILIIGNEAPIPIAVEAFSRRCLLDGVDAMGWLLHRTPEIEAFELKRAGSVVT